MTQRTPSPHPPHQDSAPAVSVLVVDDDPHIREFFCDALGDEGYHVVTASHGADALDRLRCLLPAAPSLILLDMNMPVLDGWGFAGAYRQFPKPPEHAPIVVCTAAHAAPRCAAEIGAHAFLPKPFDLSALFGILDRYPISERAA